MSRQLQGIRAKLDRAEEHFNLLDEGIKSYLEQKPYRFVVEEYAERDHYGWELFLEVDPFPPDHIWGPLIGDTVHNLRSALDHLAWGLALPKARTENPNRIEFPVNLTGEGDPERFGAFRKKIGYLRPEARAIVDGAQPYKAGDSHHPLWLLHRLWNTDKHRLLITAGFLFGTPVEDSWHGYGSWSYGPFRRHGEAENRTPLATGRLHISQGEDMLRVNVQNQMDAHENLTIDVSLGQTGQMPSVDTAYEGLPIRQVLRRIRAYVIGEVVDPLTPLI